VEIGIGLPAIRPGPYGHGMTDWARRAEERGFHSLGVLDRLVYRNYEPLVALAAAGAVTVRIRLATTVLLAGYRGNTALLAKQLVSIDHLTGGRLTVGMAAGGREDDFIVSGANYQDRGRRLDVIITELRGLFAGHGGIGPELADGGPPLLLGGQSLAAIERAARYGDGWIAGASSGRSYRDLVRTVRQAWTRCGRTERPRLVALSYFALGSSATRGAEEYVSDYYAFAGPYARKVLADVVTDADAVRRRIAERAEAGCDELIFFPCVHDSEQPELLADIALQN
jgi:alkanesulfonate monooxygenase SsuD/methylene tetrahydromethanopterin reductase-like flavin-dependent oxidoreductase (luciferase family)